MKYIPLTGRVLFALHFLMAAPMHFSAAGIGYAQMSGVPLAHILAPVSGAMALLGGLGVLPGYQAKLSAWILVAFLVSVNIMMHKFWAASYPMQQQNDDRLFYEVPKHGWRCLPNSLVWHRADKFRRKKGFGLT